MSVDVSKLVAYGAIGAPSGVSVSKLVAYVILQPGTEEGATPPVHHSFTYAQRLQLPGQSA